MNETWHTGDIGKLICNKTEYSRNFNYNYYNRNVYIKPGDNNKCIEKVSNYLDADPCEDANGKPNGICGPLDINNLNSLVQYSTPNSIVFVVTNMGITSNTTDLAENIKATAIARRIQINVLVYNNTLFLQSDPGLQYLSDIASATFGTFVLPSVKAVNEQYDVANALLNNWDQGILPSAVFSDSVKNLPVDNSLDLYVAAQTYYGDDLIFNIDQMPVVVNKTDFWKLYKLSAESFGAVLSITNQKPNTPVLVYSAGGLTAYSAFTTDDSMEQSDFVDAAYSVSVVGTGYSLVVRLESGNSVVDYLPKLTTIGSPETITLGTEFSDRSVCQFNYAINAECKSVGASVVTIVTPVNPRRSVSFPVYCASLDYAKSIYNNIVSETARIEHLATGQSISKDLQCTDSTDIFHEKYGDRSFVIVAENTKDRNETLSSADNVFRNKNSFFYQLTDFLNNNNERYSNFLAVLNNGIDFNYDQQSSDYGTFLTKVMKATENSSPRSFDAPPTDAICLGDPLTQTIEKAYPYSDILLVINYNASLCSDDSTNIKTALEKQRSKLFVLFVQTYMSYENDVYKSMNDLAISSGGLAIRVNNYDALHSFFEQFFNILVSTDIVAKAYSENQKAGIALNNVYLLNTTYYLLVTNEDLAGDGPVSATVQVDGIDITVLNTTAELQLFSLTPKSPGLFNIPIRFSTSGLAQFSNAVLFVNSANDFISLSFVDRDGANRNDVVYGEGTFTPVIYSSTPFESGSAISISYSDAANPAKQIYNGSITPVEGCNNFKSYNWTTNIDWICSISNGLYHFKIDRISANGNITRTFPITCLGANSGVCVNGGTPEGSVCSCPLQWTGDKCQIPRCLNGGTVTPADTCQCLPAFIGSFCETTIANCSNTPSVPDYRSDLSSLVIVADVNALAIGSVTADFGVTGVPITVILYGDENGPRIVQSTTNSEHVKDVLKAPATTPTPSSSPAPANSDMYNALNLALDNQLTNRAFIVVYTSNADVPIDGDFLIRLAARRAEVRVLSVSGTESQNSLTLSLVGNGIPLAVTNPNDFQNYLNTYVARLFQSLQYQANMPQPVFNVFKTDQLTGPVTVVIPKDSTFDNANATIFVHVYKGSMTPTNPPTIGTTNIYSISYNPKEEKSLSLNWLTPGQNGYYAIEIVGYLKTAYGFNKNNTNGANELVNAGVTYNVDNTIHIYSAPFADIAISNPADFPYLFIKEIQSNGSLRDPVSVLFTRKGTPNCLFRHWASLDVCSQSATIGYQVQLTTRASQSETRQQQFVLTCFKPQYSSGNTVCKGHGSPKTVGEFCDCDSNWSGIDCTEPVCQHGVRDVSVCRCPIDYYGLLCNNTFGTMPSTAAPPSTSTGSVSTGPTSTPIVSSTSPLPTTPATTTPKDEFRLAAFVIDLVGSDDYAYNQTIQSIIDYYIALGGIRYVMLTGNLNSTANLNFPFQQYTADELIAKLTIIWNYRQLPSRVSDFPSALTEVGLAYKKDIATYQSAISFNVFYLTQVGLHPNDDLTTALAGVANFQKSSVVFSPFATNADPAITDSLKPFSNDITGARTYYTALQAMVASTEDSTGASLPTKPPTLSCVYGLQCNIRVAVDFSLPSSANMNDILIDFFQKFRPPFNFIENDVDRCSTAEPLKNFYNERTAMTAFSYYEKYVTSARFCPSQYSSLFSAPVWGNTTTPDFSNKTMKNLGKNINSGDCSCNRFYDDKTLKIVLWLPRAPAPVSDVFLGYLKLNTTNAFHFVVPFYDVTKETDLFYQILTPQPKGGDYYLLPNAATAANLQTDILDPLLEKICQTAGVDPTSVPSLFDGSEYDRNKDYED